MGKYIPLDALLAGIEKRKNLCDKIALDLRSQENKDYYQGKADAYSEMAELVNTLEVKEVDFHKELLSFYRHANDCGSNIALAKHFFELGMRFNNPITAADRGTAEEIIINLKRVEQDYRINLTKEIEWVRNQVKKGD